MLNCVESLRGFLVDVNLTPRSKMEYLAKHKCVRREIVNFREICAIERKSKTERRRKNMIGSDP